MVEPKFCWSCGHPITPGYKFCEACGADLIPSGQKTTPSANNTETSQSEIALDSEGYVTPSNVGAPESLVPANQYTTGSLFDPQHEFYVLHEKYWNWGSGDILDEKGVVIGKMHRVFLSLRARIELKEVDGTLSAQIHQKIPAK